MQPHLAHHYRNLAWMIHPIVMALCRLVKLSTLSGAEDANILHL